MKTSEIRNKTENELKELSKKLKKELSDTRISVLQGKEKNNKKSLNIRRSMAKVLTILNEKLVLQHTVPHKITEEIKEKVKDSKEKDK